MPTYKPVEGLSEDHDSLKEYYADKISWSVREGIAEQEIGKRVGKDANILDTGCGGGAFLAKLKAGGYTNLYGTDLENYLADIKKEELRGYSETNLSTEKMSFANGTIDVVTALAFVEHIENAFHFARESARVLKPGGYLLMTMPHIENLKSRLSFLIGKHLDGYTSHNDHIMVLPKEVFAKCFLGQFELEETIYGNAFVRIPFTKKKLRKVSPRLFGNKILYILKKK